GLKQLSVKASKKTIERHDGVDCQTEIAWKGSCEAGVLGHNLIEIVCKSHGHCSKTRVRCRIVGRVCGHRLMASVKISRALSRLLPAYKRGGSRPTSPSCQTC